MGTYFEKGVGYSEANSKTKIPTLNQLTCTRLAFLRMKRLLCAGAGLHIYLVLKVILYLVGVASSIYPILQVRRLRLSL